MEKDRFKNGFYEAYVYVYVCVCVCVCMPVDLYQPFLPAGRAPSPVGCESCL